MKRLVSRIALLLAASLLLPLSAQAQLFRAYLASYGNDGNPCTVGAPCRLLPAAIAAVHDAGEIWMLDSANFNGGTVNVTKSVKIQAIPGQVGSIVPVASAPAMILSPGVAVTLRNVAVVTNANNPGTDGIQMTTGSLTIEDSVFEVSGGTASAISVQGAGVLSVHDSVFRNGYTGISVSAGGSADVSTSKFVNNANLAVYVDGNVGSTTTKANVRDSYFSDDFVAVAVESDVTGAPARVTVTGCSISNGGYGIVSESALNTGAAATATVANTTIAGESSYAFYTFAVSGSTAVVESQGNNTVRGNGGVSNAGITTFSGV